ncbi:MAG: hypothetical protein WBN89_06725 [Prochlorococcaceae cyanobacterium]
MLLLSGKGALINDVVIALTVLADLMVAVGWTSASPASSGSTR